jgi:hypothetical protein
MLGLPAPPEPNPETERTPKKYSAVIRAAGFNIAYCMRLTPQGVVWMRGNYWVETLPGVLDCHRGFWIFCQVLLGKIT